MKKILKLTIFIFTFCLLISFEIFSQYSDCAGVNTGCASMNTNDYNTSGRHLSQTHLKYFVATGDLISYNMLKSALLIAFNIWSSEVPFTYEEVFDESSAFIKLHAPDDNGFYSSGASTRARAVSWTPGCPCNGTILVRGVLTSFNLTAGSEWDLAYYVAHELGHTFGLCHTWMHSSSMMYFDVASKRSLDEYDKKAIHEVYNAIIAVQNKIENQDNTFNVGGGIVCVDDVDYSTDLIPNKQQMFPFVSGETHKFEAKDQIYNNISRKFNPYTTANGGWFKDNNFRIGTSSVLNTAISSGTYTAIYRSKLDVNYIVKSEFDGNMSLGTSYQEFYQYDTKPLNFPSTQRVGSNIYQYSYIDSYDKGRLNSDGTFTPTTNCNVTAFYKIPTKSNSQTAFSNSGQRKFIRTSDGYLHLVYESMNKIWYERSTDGGATWTIQNNGKPLNTDYVFNKQTGQTTGTGSYTVAKQPAIDYLGNMVIAVWEEQSGTNYVVRLCVLNNGLPVSQANDIPFQSYGQYTEDITPEIAVKDDNNLMIAIRRNDAYLKGLECHYSMINTFTGRTTESGSGYVPGTDVNSKNFSLATYRSSQDIYHLAWQQDGSGSSSINYARFNFKYVDNGGALVMSMSPTETLAPGGGTWTIQILKSVNISSPTYNTYSYSPSVIAASDGSARVSFKGYYEYDPGYGSYTMSLVNPDNFSYIPYLNKYGGDIFSSQLSLGSDTYFMGWTEFYNNAYRAICTDSHTLRDMETVNNAFGKDIQINNGGTKDQQYVMSLNSESPTLPYSFTRSDAIGTIVVNKKSSISNGRGIFLTKDNAQVHFILGNVKANEVNVNFVDIKDTVKFDNITKVNSYLVTEPFTISDNSSFNFAVSYGSRDSVLTKSSLKEGQYGSFKVELIDAISGKLLGSYLDVNINKNNVFGMKESSFKVSGSGAGSQLVRLRLSVDENMNSQYTVSDMLLGKGILLSKSSVEENELNYKGTLEVKDFALEQNYPNPFNPTTVISYALPKAAYVSLKVYDVLGKEVRTLVNEYKAEGRYSVQFNANSLPSGIYVYQLKAGNNIVSRKMMLVK